MSKRTNTYKIEWDNPKQAYSIGFGCAVMWNKLNYRRRQSFFDDNSSEIDWSYKDIYDELKGWIGSSMAQQIIRKNTQAWNSFFGLLKLKGQGKLPPEIEHVGPPGYWKDRQTNKKNPIIILRNDCYKIEEGDNESKILKMPKKVNSPSELKGKTVWKGKQGSMECIYDRLNKNWYGYQSIEVEFHHQVSNQEKTAFVDLGIKCPIVVVFEGSRQAIAYSGKHLMSDWYYISKRISAVESKLKLVNNKHKSQLLSTLYRKRKRRYRHGVNTLVCRFIKECKSRNITKIVMGDLTGIRQANTKEKNRVPKNRQMINNIWSHAYLTQRIELTAEREGIEVEKINEGYTSSWCPYCGSFDVFRNKRLFRCKSCHTEFHRDVVGSHNISIVYNHENGHGECDNGVLAHPLFAET